jgi:hypothetical protein
MQLPKDTFRPGLSAAELKCALRDTLARLDEDKDPDAAERSREEHKLVEGWVDKALEGWSPDSKTLPFSLADLRGLKDISTELIARLALEVLKRISKQTAPSFEATLAGQLDHLLRADTKVFFDHLMRHDEVDETVISLDTIAAHETPWRGVAAHPLDRAAWGIQGDCSNILFHDANNERIQGDTRQGSQTTSGYREVAPGQWAPILDDASMSFDMLRLEELKALHDRIIASDPGRARDPQVQSFLLRDLGGLQGLVALKRFEHSVLMAMQQRIDAHNAPILERQRRIQEIFSFPTIARSSQHEANGLAALLARTPRRSRSSDALSRSRSIDMMPLLFRPGWRPIDLLVGLRDYLGELDRSGERLDMPALKRVVQRVLDAKRPNSPRALAEARDLINQTGNPYLKAAMILALLREEVADERWSSPEEWFHDAFERGELVKELEHLIALRAPSVLFKRLFTVPEPRDRTGE